VIQRKTVLVLGAGASEPFGFPIGKKLVEMIVGDLTNPEGTETGKVLINYGFDSVKHMLGPRDSAEVDYVGYDCLQFLRSYPILF
jgi:hypothetical protein